MTSKRRCRQLVALLASLLLLTTGTLSLASASVMAASAPDRTAMASPMAAHGPEMAGMPCHEQPDTVVQHQNHNGCPMGTDRCHCAIGTSIAPPSLTEPLSPILPQHATPNRMAPPPLMAGIRDDLLRPPQI